MVSFFLDAVPANVLIARAICNDNVADNASYICFGALIRIRGDKRLVLKRGIVEQAIGRALTENEWQSVTWNHIGAISKFERAEIVFENSEESRVLDEFWDKRLENVKKNKS
ncbi:MAG: hypothetical protein U9N61_01505 [Euryarchaeota archaeon]|nr:hypothetical protein [Euryarchaeota archaeon]